MTDNVTRNDDLIQNSFLSGSTFLKRFLGYPAVTTTVQKSVEIYNKAKSSSKLLGNAFTTVETSVQKIRDSQLGNQVGKYVDTTMKTLDDKFAVNEKGNKVLDLVEEKTEKVLETAKPYYEQGRVIVEKKTEGLVNLYNLGRKTLVENYDAKKDQMVTLYTKGKTTFEEKNRALVDEYQQRINEYRKKRDEVKKKGEEFVSLSIERALPTYILIKEHYFDKPQKFVVELLNSKYQALKKEYDTVKRVDELLQKGKELAGKERERAVQVYTQACQFYNTQKETVKQTGTAYYTKATEYLKVQQKNLFDAIDDKYKNLQTNPNEAKTLMDDLTKALYNLKEGYLAITNNGLNIHLSMKKN